MMMITGRRDNFSTRAWEAQGGREETKVPRRLKPGVYDSYVLLKSEYLIRHVCLYDDKRR